MPAWGILLGSCRWPAPLLPHGQPRAKPTQCCQPTVHRAWAPPWGCHFLPMVPTQGAHLSSKCLCLCPQHPLTPDTSPWLLQPLLRPQPDRGDPRAARVAVWRSRLALHWSSSGTPPTLKYAHWRAGGARPSPSSQGHGAPTPPGASCPTSRWGRLGKWVKWSDWFPELGEESTGRRGGGEERLSQGGWAGRWTGVGLQKVSFQAPRPAPHPRRWPRWPSVGQELLAAEVGTTPSQALISKHRWAREEPSLA